MKTLLVTLILAALITVSGRGQDSLYYVHLRNGTTVYSRKVTLVNSLARGKYLLLDTNRRITLDLVRDFKGWGGTYAVGMLGGYHDVFRLQDEGRRISLYSKCYYETETVWSSAGPGQPETPTTITTREKAWFFRKGPDGDIERVTIPNLRTAMADNAASLAQLKVAGTNLHVAIGLLAAGAGAAFAGIIVTHQRNTAAYNTYKQESATWYNNSLSNPNAPMPTLTHYGLSPLFYVGSAMVLSGFVPILNVRRHLVKALDIYNGNE
jgi:hypothetical protein